MSAFRCVLLLAFLAFASLYAPRVVAATTCALAAEQCDEGQAAAACFAAIERSTAHAKSVGYDGAVMENCRREGNTVGRFICAVRYGSVWKCIDPAGGMQNAYEYVDICLARPEQVDKWVYADKVCHDGCVYYGYRDPVTGSTFFSTFLQGEPPQICVPGNGTNGGFPDPEDCPVGGCSNGGDGTCPVGQSDPDGDGVCTPDGGQCLGNKTDPDGDGVCSCPAGTSDPDNDNTCTSTGGGGDDGGGDDDGGSGTCNPRVEDCTGAGGVGSNLNSELYTRDQVSAESQIARLLAGVREAPIAQYATSFFGGCSGAGGSCPSESWTAGLWGYSFDLGLFCAGALASLIAFAGWVSLTGMALFAFRVALL